MDNSTVYIGKGLYVMTGSTPSVRPPKGTDETIGITRHPPRNLADQKDEQQRIMRELMLRRREMLS